jgi:hypothetical protein
MNPRSPWLPPAALLSWTLIAPAFPGTVHGAVTPILHYRMEGTPGTQATTVVDDANGNDGTPAASPVPVYVADDPGCGQTSLSFSGGFLAFDPVPQLSTLSGDLTVEALFKSTQPVSSPQQFLVSNWPFGSGWQFALEVRTDGRPQITFSSGAGAQNDAATSPDPIQADVWYHVAGVRDAGSGEVRLYLGGTLVDSASLMWALSSDNTAFAIGARYSSELFFHGSIAEVRVTDAALDPADFIYPCGVTAVGPDSPVASLSPASPNPFRHGTTIAYGNGRAGPVAVTVHDVQGRLVATLLDRFEAGSGGTVRWNGTDALGRPVAAGVYFCRIATGPQARTERLVLVR